jgi:hypothetical protein
VSFQGQPRSNRRRFRALGPTLGVALTALVALWSVPVALADSARSSNWAGYSIHRAGVRFRHVSAVWRQPGATCTPGTATYSSIWVGLGGFNRDAKALEQIGSEVDCSADGRIVSSVWYELVPEPSHTISLAVAPGDVLSASLTVKRHSVTLTLRDLTRESKFTRRTHASSLDLRSADWIVEAPSECQGPTSCQPLPLANFGSASFAHAHAATAKGHSGRISSRKWDTTKITLVSRARHFVSSDASTDAQANPSRLSARGGSFTVTYSGAASTSRAAVSGNSPIAARLLRPGRVGP